MFKGLGLPFNWDYQADLLRERTGTTSKFKDFKIPYRYIDEYKEILIDMLKEIEKTVETLVELNELYLTNINKFFNVSRFDTTNKLAKLRFIWAGMKIEQEDIKHAIFESLERARYLIELALIDLHAYKTKKLADGQLLPTND